MAKNLLSEDGIIAVHIDEHEYVNLEKLLSEIFGSNNNLGTVVWDKRNPKGNARGIAQQHEYISIYARNADAVKDADGMRRKKENAKAILTKAKKLISKAGCVDDDVRNKFKSWISNQNFSGGEKAYAHIDDQGQVYRTVSMASPSNKPIADHYFEKIIHPVTKKPCPTPAKGWRNSSTTMQKLLSEGKIIFGKDERKQPERKYLLKENMSESFPSILYFGGSDDKLFKSMDLIFDNPKPVYISKRLIEACCPHEGTVLDFFAGSSTCAHATLALNTEDGVNRRFMMVQIDEPIPKDNLMRKKGFASISKLSATRIQRAGEKMLMENYHPDWNRDVGFRFLKVDTSNMRDVHYAPDQIDQKRLLDAVDNIKLGRTHEDLLLQVLVNWGVDLTLPIRSKTIQNKRVFFVGGNVLAACFESDVSEDLVQELANHKIRRIVFRDNGFVSDSVKINVEQLFKQLSPMTDIKAI